MNKFLKWTLVVLIVAGAAGALGWHWWQKQQSALPEGIASGNGRIEADEVDISVTYAGRVKDIFVHEGDIVEVGQTLVVMDTAELQAQVDGAKADLAQGEEAVNEAQAQVVRAGSDLVYAQQQYDRTDQLVKRGMTTQSLADEGRNARDAARAAVSAAEARLRTLQKGIDAYRASVRQIEAQLDEATLTAPVVGRVLYRLAQKGEVLGSGGKILTLLDLSSVYMEIFLPATSAGVLQIGSEARILLDIAPDLPIPARVTFVSPQAQFTPKQVETRSEREKLMFRVKLQIPTELVLKNIERVKTGLRGVGYVRADERIPWPAFLDGRLTAPDNDGK